MIVHLFLFRRPAAFPATPAAPAARSKYSCTEKNLHLFGFVRILTVLTIFIERQ